MMNKNSLAAKVTNIDGLPRKGLLPSATAEVAAEVGAIPSMGEERLVATADQGSMKIQDSKIGDQKSYADQLKQTNNNPTSQAVNFRFLVNEETRDGFDIVLPKAAVSKVKELRKRLDEIQRAMDIDPLNCQLGEEEKTCLNQYNEACLDEERFLKQKAKIHWLAVGDANNSFFHNSLKCKHHGNRIEVIKDVNGELHEGENVPTAFVSHFQQFLGCDETLTMDPSPELSDEERKSEGFLEIGVCSKR
ncbi:hypothetical protein QVD17_00060 [Tagetes erecta]|uniref:Uncharacterized protein n=1 Tax=Tagetes erecta TaxID=13708 RepID=A0AAD8L9G0_TARER|nr:hypothetical protein QVD17_00059 [Tagetes erecta]KAK1434322.1 hypothetical protein QVD17_00060 [Tagetes erecta]